MSFGNYIKISNKLIWSLGKVNPVARVNKINHWIIAIVLYE